jgi:hypothetical protein
VFLGIDVLVTFENAQRLDFLCFPIVVVQSLKLQVLVRYHQSTHPQPHKFLHLFTVHFGTHNDVQYILILLKLQFFHLDLINPLSPLEYLPTYQKIS